MNANWLKARTFGMPRWAWMALLMGGIAVGLYFRAKQGKEEKAVELASEEPVAPYSLEANASDPGLAGVVGGGTFGPAQGQVVPVSTPYLPEGVTDLFGNLADIMASLTGALTEVRTVPSAPTQEGTSPVPEVTGGGPPPAPEHTTPAAPSCSANDRAEIGRLTTELQQINSRLDYINNVALPHANAEFQKARQKKQTGDGWRKQIDALQAERSNLQTQRDYKQAKRAPIQERCR